MPSYEFTYNATPELARQAALRYIWRCAGWWLIFLVIAVLFCLISLLNGDHSWYVILLLTAASIKIWVWIRSYLKAGSTVQAVANPKVTVFVDDEHLEMKYAETDTKVNWKAPIEIWRFKEIWLITHLDTKTSTYIPTNVLPDDVQRFIEAKVVENGGNIS
ncbi:YcxB family protein [Bythopirellula goksoeyrii]|uniref:YcxB-like C-terminal domain-containing protein n=1 Tax=Bythopirellula goksoeyrii TaxID=1400387 RepID=A0A5B9QK74_9BACT|nr:YcxB family protein [Bythopirellula goksoeyrii]QEG37456.1 hypothetical protein Pr1d_48020 [Bythopirellula goksoeyrii]